MSATRRRVGTALSTMLYPGLPNESTWRILATCVSSSDPRRRTIVSMRRSSPSSCYLDEVPTVHVPSPAIRAWCGTAEHRARLVRRRTQIKNRLRALLRTCGIIAPRGLWTIEGRQWLTDVELPSALDMMRRDMLLDELATTEKPSPACAAASRCRCEGACWRPTAQDDSRSRHANGRDGSRVHRRPTAVQVQQVGGELLRLGATAGCERIVQPPRSHYEGGAGYGSIPAHRSCVARDPSFTSDCRRVRLLVASSSPLMGAIAIAGAKRASRRVAWNNDLRAEGWLGVRRSRGQSSSAAARR